MLRKQTDTPYCHKTHFFTFSQFLKLQDGPQVDLVPGGECQTAELVRLKYRGLLLPKISSSLGLGISPKSWSTFTG